MIIKMDSIKFENRQEISEIINALEEWQENHKTNKTVKEMISKLDVMEMSW